MAKKHKHAGHGVKHTHITHHHDGSHTIEHSMEDGSTHPGNGAAMNLDGVHDKLEANLGSPNPGEAVPAAAPPAPAAPMPPPPAAM